MMWVATQKNQKKKNEKKKQKHPEAGARRGGVKRINPDKGGKESSKRPRYNNSPEEERWGRKIVKTTTRGIAT